jgi:hypothetical protein
MHVDEAARQLADARADSAQAEINKAESFAKVAGELLPVTV